MAPKKGGKKAPKPEVTLEQLIAAAEDFNSFMFASADEGIPTDLEYKELLAEVTETAEELEATDTILAVTAETLDLLGVEFAAFVAEEEAEEEDDVPEPEEEAKAAPKGKGKGKPAAKVEESEEQENEDAAKVADIALIKKTKDVEKMKTVAKAWGIRIPPPFYKDTAKLREYLVGKLDGSAPPPAKEKKEKPVKAEKVEKPAKTEKKEKVVSEEKYTRSNALIDSLKAVTGTREQIINKADDLFVENGGKTNTNVSNYMFGYVLPSLIIIGAVSKSGDKYTWNK